ncbi:hypothetical protein BV25DRAFT_1831994 [Artomyces pyxidatus]|uniref:Uncharacterized protein n=1 Tax=Artomyces pyxidatus TaxID=48021 RepID=A0ACB8SLA2_9AGAM|nr:hypothetical protein BV25DRAFT_1831994 [Artomyces pyxidatus]
MGFFSSLACSCLRVLLEIMLACLTPRNLADDLPPVSVPGHLTFNAPSPMKEPSQNVETEVQSLAEQGFAGHDDVARTPPVAESNDPPSLSAAASQSLSEPPSPTVTSQDDCPELTSSSSFTLAPPPADAPALMSVALPSSASVDSVFYTPTLSGSGSVEHTQPYTPTRQPGLLSKAMLTDTSDSDSDVLVGLGIEFRYADSGKPFDGLGILSQQKDSDAWQDDSGVEFDVPSRIFLDEIYHTFTSPSMSPDPLPPSRTSATPSPPFRFADVSFRYIEDADADDVFVERYIPGPVAASTPRKKQRQRGPLEYVRPTISSMARRAGNGEWEGDNQSFGSSGSSSGGSCPRPVWKY